jgi:MAternally-affected-uncoordination protein
MFLQWFASGKVAHVEDDVRFESASVLAELLSERAVASSTTSAPTQMDAARQVLRKAIEMSQQNSYWHCRLLFQLASIHATEKDYVSAVSILGAGVDFAYMAGANYTRLLFMLSKTMVRGGIGTKCKSSFLT